MSDDNNPFQELYKLFSYLDIDPKLIDVNYDHEESDDHILIAFPSLKMGIAVENDIYDNMREDGWDITQLSVHSVMEFASVFASVEGMRFEMVRRRSQEAQLKAGSSHEEALLKAILEANLPEPDRNLSILRENGKVLTVPDFAWEDIKLAFFLDGIYWHRLRDDKEMIEKLRSSEKGSDVDKEIIKNSKLRAEKDAAARSQMSYDGWTILSCTDTQLEAKSKISQKKVREQVAGIKKVYRRLSAALAQEQPNESADDEFEDVQEAPDDDEEHSEDVESAEDSSKGNKSGGISLDDIL